MQPLPSVTQHFHRESYPGKRPSRSGQWARSGGRLVLVGSVESDRTGRVGVVSSLHPSVWASQVGRVSHVILSVFSGAVLLSLKATIIKVLLLLSER